MKPNWLPIAGGVAVGIVGLLIYQGYANAAPAALPAAAATVTVNLQPGSTAIAVAPGGTVSLVLPTGATWSTSSSLPAVTGAGTGQPTGSQTWNVNFPSAVGGTIICNWVDSTNTAQSTQIAVSVSTVA